MEHDPNIENDFTGTAPKLSALGKENPFGVPDNYFEILPESIIEKCTKSEKQHEKKHRHIGLRNVFIPLAAAASLILVILIYQRKYSARPSEDTQYAYTYNSDAQEYLDYLVDNDELDESLIISEIINDDTIKNISSSKAEENIKIQNENPVIFSDTVNNVVITEDDIIQYLLEEDESDDLLN